MALNKVEMYWNLIPAPIATGRGKEDDGLMGSHWSFNCRNVHNYPSDDTKFVQGMRKTFHPAQHSRKRNHTVLASQRITIDTLI